MLYAAQHSLIWAFTMSLCLSEDTKYPKNLLVIHMEIIHSVYPDKKVFRAISSTSILFKKVAYGIKLAGEKSHH
jgi:uncharacterized lipoprotein YehR (DUF1307 family)